MEYYINFGASSSMTSGGKTWIVGTATSSGGSISSVTTNTYSGITSPPVCSTLVQARTGNTGKDINFSLSGLPAGTYVVKTYFMETENSSNRRGTFDIYIEGARVVSNYNPANQGVKVAQSLSGSYAVTDGTFNLLLDPGSGIPNICAVEIVRSS